MHFLSSLLFVVACFTFIYFCFNFAVDITNAFCNAIAGESSHIYGNPHAIATGISFAYMMMYLFIW